MAENEQKTARSGETAAAGKTKFGADLDFASTEAYNLLRTNLSFSFADKEGGRIIGVTSGSPHEGKSTTSINLSYSLAAEGKRVVLVDADLRRPSLAKNLKMPQSPGLSNLLVDSTAKVVHSGVLHENLCTVLSGDIPPNPSELLASSRMQSVIEFFASHYDYVIVDLPPVTAVSDPLVVSKYLDGVVVVVKHGYSKRALLMDAIRQLQFTGIRILGFVYNGATRGGGSYRKGYYKSHYGGYGHYYGEYKQKPEENGNGGGSK